MIEGGVELLLSMLDYAYCLYFYKVIIQEKWISKKTITLFFSVVLLQFMKEQFLSFTMISLILDNFIMISFLCCNAKEKSIVNFIMALVTNVIFAISILIYISVCVEIGVDVHVTLSFGFERILFALSMKVFTVMIFFILKKPLIILRNSMINLIDYIVILLLSFLSLSVTYIISNVKGNNSIIIFSLLLLIIAVLIFYLIYKYGMLLKSNAESEIIQHEKQITYDYVERLEKEHEEVRKIRHDIKNQLQTMQTLMYEKKYNEIEQNIVDLTNTLDANKVSITGNVYVDALLRQKMKEFFDVTFELDIAITDDFVMNGTDLISLLANIIDNACEELYRIQEKRFYLKVRGNKEQLSIKEHNACRRNHDLKSRKNKKEHGLGLKIIQEVVDKYEGVINKTVNDNSFEISIFILF